MTGLVVTMYEQIGYSVADDVAKAVFRRAIVVSSCLGVLWYKFNQVKHWRTHEYVGRLLVDVVD